MTRPPSPILFLLALILPGFALHASDQIKLANGDHVTGQIVRETTDTIVLKTEFLGEITLPKSKIGAIKRDSGQIDSPEALAGIAPEPQAPATPPAPPNGHRPDKSAEKKLSDTSPPWKGKVELGFRQQQGKRESINFDLRTSAERKTQNDSFAASAKMLYGSQDGKVNNDSYDGSFRWRRELSDRTFAQSLTSYSRNQLKGINSNWEQNIGAGVRLLKTEDHVVNVGAGLTGQYRDADGTEATFYGLVEVFQDYAYQINKRLTLQQNAAAQYTPDGQARFVSVPNQPSATNGEANYKVKFNTTLQGKITERVSMNLRFEYEFDNAVVSESARADQRITSSIGYGF